MNNIWDLCKLLNNPKKMRLFQSICLAGKQGVSVMALTEEMGESGLGKSGISQYLKQMAQLGLVRRDRKGATVVYFYDVGRARKEVREVAEMIATRISLGGDMGFVQALRTLMNPFRAKVASLIYHKEAGDSGEICKRMMCSSARLYMAMKLGIEDGIFTYEGGKLALQASGDVIIQRIIELVP